MACRRLTSRTRWWKKVPAPGGLEAGLPDIHVVPDLSSLTALPWEPNAAWCIGEAFTPDGAPAPEAPRTMARRVADRLSALGYELACGPELEFYLCQQAPDGQLGGRLARQIPQVSLDNGGRILFGHGRTPPGLARVSLNRCPSATAGRDETPFTQ